MLASPPNHCQGSTLNASPDLSALRIHRDEEAGSRPRRSFKGLIWLAAVAAVLAAGFALWSSGLMARTPEVRVARPRLVTAGGVEEILTATGYLVPQLRSVVSAQASGRLEWIGVDEGSRVTKGEVIARLSKDDLSAQVAEARASLAQARATLEQTRSTLWEAAREQERQKNLLAEGITTQSSFDSARRAHDVAQAGVSAAEEAVRAAQARLNWSLANEEKTIVRAPFDGTVILKSAEVGEMVAAGAFSGQPTGGAIATVADFSTIEMEADVNETNVSKVAEGQAALISVDAVPDRKYRGILRSIVPAADRQKAVVQAKVHLLDPDDRILPDLSARVSFLSREVSAEEAAARARIFVPAAAVRSDAAGPFVMAVRDDRLVRLGVTLGESRGDLREVTSGLAGDESLVVEGAEGSSPGARVRLAS